MMNLQEEKTLTAAVLFSFVPYLGSTSVIESPKLPKMYEERQRQAPSDVYLTDKDVATIFYIPEESVLLTSLGIEDHSEFAFAPEDIELDEVRLISPPMETRRIKVRFRYVGDEPIRISHRED